MYFLVNVRKPLLQKDLEIFRMDSGNTSPRTVSSFRSSNNGKTSSRRSIGSKRSSFKGNGPNQAQDDDAPKLIELEDEEEDDFTNLKKPDSLFKMFQNSVIIYFHIISNITYVNFIILSIRKLSKK